MSIFEQLVLDSLALNDRTNFILQGFDPGIAPKRWQWISGTDSDGAVLPEEAHYDNAEMTLRIRIAPQASMDAALTKIGQIVDKLQECEQQPLGLPLVWTPNNSTKSLTAYVLGGEVTGIPQSMSGDDAGWFLRNPAPVVTVKLYRRPFLYGTEVTSAATVTNTDPVQLLTVASVTGDVPAEARLVVTDAATQSRRHVEWGREWRYYNAATSLLIDSDSLTATGGAGSTRTGAYDPGAVGNSVIRGTLTTSPVSICSTGNLSHVGTFRVKARVYAAPVSDATADDFHVRFSWKEGDGPLRSNTYTSPVAVNGWSEVDLGLISIPEKTLGTQRWTGQVEAYSEDAGDVLDVDYIVLIPAGEGYGRARAPITLATPSAFSARDEFDQTAGNLGLPKALPVGGNWATSGAATDLAVEATGHTATRTAAGQRYAIAGTTTFTACQVSIDFKGADMSDAVCGVIARWTDASNYLYAVYSAASATPFLVGKFVAGSETQVAIPQNVVLDNNATYTLKLSVDAAGSVVAALFVRGSGSPFVMSSGAHPDLATGGTLASGKVGFTDASSTGVGARNYDNFWASTGTADAVVFSGRAAEIRHDSAIRQDSTGTYYGPINSYRGARFYLMPAGDESRTNRILVKARRNDIDVAQDDQIADSTTSVIHYTPRYLVAPR